MSNSFKVALIAAAMAVTAAGPAHALDGVLAGMQSYDCVGPAPGGPGTFNNETILSRALMRHGVLFEPTRGYDALADEILDPRSNFGERARAEAFNRQRGLPVARPLEGADRARADLYLAVYDLVTGVDQRPRSEIRLSNAPGGDDPTPEHVRARMRDFLSRRATWITVTCVVPEASQPSRDTAASWISRTRVAQTLDGARGALKDSNYATISGRWDDTNQTDTFSFEGVALFPPLFRTSDEYDSEQTGLIHDFRLQPFVGYQRTEADDPSKEVNNVTVGIDMPFTIDDSDAAGWLPNVHNFAFSLEYQTDDHFDSAMTRAEFSYYPSWGGRLGDDRRADCLSGRCGWGVAGVLDYADVHDTTRRPKLADIEQFARVGFNVSAGYYMGPPDGWEVSLTGDYRHRESLNDEGGDASLFKGRIAFAPSATGHVSFGLDYVSGEDLTSLADQEYWAISIGFRN